jgi:uncharacterized protein
LSKIWSQSLNGRPIDLVEPKACDVDLRECCEMLANINRWVGSAQQNVSVAFHTLIAIDCAEEAIKPWVALHDFHETRIGDFGAPVKLAMIAIAGEMGGQFSEAMRWTLAEMARRHDVAIHAAAGLPMPTPEQHVRIKVADMRALVTERRDFLAPCPRRFAPEVERAQPATRVYRAGSFGKSPFDIALALYQRLELYLPALQKPRAKVSAPARASV